MRTNKHTKDKTHGKYINIDNDESMEEIEMSISEYVVNISYGNLVSGKIKYYEPTCPGDSGWDIFDNEYHNITENYIVWFNISETCQNNFQWFLKSY